MKTKPAALLILVVILGLLLPSEAVAEFTVLPPDFDDEEVVINLGSPTAIDWLPASENDDLLTATQSGLLFRESASVLNLSNSICSGGEMGLLGLAVDPDFTSGERFVYVYYTHRRGSADCGPASRANRVSRFTMDAQDNLGGELVLIDNIPAPGGNHNGGDLQFGNDGLLYVSVGDGGQDLTTGSGQNGNGNARRLDVLVGKILRIDADGGIPAGNPFQGSGTGRCAATGGAQSEAGSVNSGDQAEKKSKKKRKAKKKKHKADKNKKKHKRQKRRQQKRRNQPTQAPAAATICQEIFATGLRNPYRITFDPNDTNGAQRFYINDVGGSAWEEIDAGAPGADYGWNVREGPCPTGTVNNCSPDTRFVDPIFAYRHQTGCRTITGGAFVPESAAWPAAYDGVYFYADFLCGKLFALRNGTLGHTSEEVASGTGATHLAFGPDGALYYTTFAVGGQVRRIVAPEAEP